MENNSNPIFTANEDGALVANDNIPETQPQVVPEQVADQPPAKKKSVKKLVSLIIVLLILAGLIFAASRIDYTVVIDNIAGSNYVATEEMQKLIDALDLTEDGRRIFYATHPELQESEAFNSNCDSDDSESLVLGCYKNNHIYAYNVKNSDLDGIRQTTLAHELLHAVWHRMSNSDRDALKADLLKVRDENEEVKSKSELYNESSLYNELHSIIGSQVRPDKMPEALRNHYAKYFKDLDKIAAYYEAYSSIYQAAIARVNELKDVIDERRAKYSEMLADYDRNNAQLTADINNFNARARTTGGFQTEDEFDREYQALISRQRKLVADYQALLVYANESNEIIAEYNANIARTEQYAQSINSNISAPAENN